MSSISSSSGTSYTLINGIVPRLTNGGGYELQVEITNDASAVAFARYDKFEIKEVGTDYKLVVGSFRTDDFEWDAGDALSRYDGILFSAKDRDNSNSSGDCLRASDNHAGW